MFIHGVLHLLGYAHMIDADAEAMEGIEARLLQKFRLKKKHSFLCTLIYLIFNFFFTYLK